MKFISVFILFTILFAAISSRRIRSHRAHRHRSRTVGTLVFQFCKALILELGQVSDADIDKCLPDGWKSAKPTDPEDSTQKDAGSSLEQQKTGWQSVLEKLGKAINLVCKVKDIVQQAIEFFSKDNKTRFRRYYRLFLQGKTKTFRRIKWSFSGFISKAKDVVTSAASKIKQGVIKIADNVVDTAKDVYEQITNVLQTVFSPIIDIFEKIKTKIIEFFKRPFIEKLILWINCIKNIKTLGANIVTLVTNYITLVGELTTPAGWVKFIVKLICAWEDLAKAIGYLREGLNATATPAIKWQKIGQFIGKLIVTIGN